MTYRQRLRALAFDTHGVVTTRGAQAIGVPPVELRKLASRGALARLGHGVYRMLEAPVGRLNEFAEAVALVGEDAMLVDESVLAAHDLAQVNLRRIRVASARRIRAKLPDAVEVVYREVPERDRDFVDGIPAMTIEAALLAARGRVMTDRLVGAAHTAAARGLISAEQETRLIAALA